MSVCVSVVKIEFHRKRKVERQVEKGRGREIKAKAAKVGGNVLSLHIPFTRQRQVEKGRGRQR